MATVIPAGMYVAKLRWRLEGDSDEMISTIALRNNEPGEREPNEVAHAVYGAFRGAFGAAVLCAPWSFVGVDIIEGSDTPNTRVGTWNEITAGSASNAPLPQNCAMLVKKLTAAAGRRNSGRMYLPSGYLPEADVDPNGRIAGSALVDQMNRANQFYENLRDSTAPILADDRTSFQPVILHSPPKPPPPVQGSNVPPVAAGPTEPPTDITSLTVDPVIATQRGRMRR